MTYLAVVLQLSSSFTLLVALSRSLRAEIAKLLGMKDKANPKTPMTASKRAWEGQ